MANWLDKFIKRAVDKLPQDELNGQFPPFTGAAAGDPSAGAPPDPNAAPPMDPSMGGGMPPMDPSMMGMMPPPEEKPLVWNNKYLVKTDSTEFVVELSPKIISAPPPMPPMPQAPPPGAPQDPMADKSQNPNADPQALQDWINSESQNLGQSKPFSDDEKAPADPLTAEEDGLPIEDTGDEKNINPKVKVHQKKAAADIMPGIDRSNAYAPCSFCANYIAADNDCSQGLDVEKVQAAKSCSWLNSTMKPFGKGKDSFNEGRKDKDTTTTDVADIGGGGEGGQGGPNKFASLRDKLNRFM